MRRLRPLVRELLQFVRLVILLAAACGGIGALYSVVSGHDLRNAVVSALIIGGGVLFVGSAFADGGARRRRIDRMAAGTRALALEVPFGWLLVGLGLIGVGVIFAVI